MKMAVFCDLRCIVWQDFTNISEELALFMEAAVISETSVNFYQTTRRNFPEDSHHIRRRENLNSHRRSVSYRFLFEHAVNYTVLITRLPFGKRHFCDVRGRVWVTDSSAHHVERAKGVVRFECFCSATSVCLVGHRTVSLSFLFRVIMKDFDGWFYSVSSTSNNERALGTTEVL
jgi:hypothetical protein